MEIIYLVFPPAVLYCNILNVVQLQQLTRGKTMQNFQLSLFYDLQEFIRSSNFYRKYYLLFGCLPVLRFPDRNINVGRTGYSRHAMLRAPQLPPLAKGARGDFRMISQSQKHAFNPDYS